MLYLSVKQRFFLDTGIVPSLLECESKEWSLPKDCLCLYYQLWRSPFTTFPLHNFRYGIGENSIPPWKEKNFSDLALLARAWYARVLPSCGSFELVLLRTSGRGMTTCARTWTMCVLIVEKLFVFPTHKFSLDCCTSACREKAFLNCREKLKSDIVTIW